MKNQKSLENQKFTKNLYFDNIKNISFEKNQNGMLDNSMACLKKHATIQKLIADKKVAIKKIGNMVCIKCKNEIYTTGHVYNENGQIIAQIVSNICKSILGKENVMAYWEKRKNLDVIWVGYDIIPMDTWEKVIFGGKLNKTLSERAKMRKYNGWKV